MKSKKQLWVKVNDQNSITTIQVDFLPNMYIGLATISWISMIQFIRVKLIIRSIISWAQSLAVFIITGNRWQWIAASRLLSYSALAAAVPLHAWLGYSYTEKANTLIHRQKILMCSYLLQVSWTFIPTVVYRQSSFPELGMDLFYA